MEIEELYTKLAETDRQESLDSKARCDLCIKNTEDITEAFRNMAEYLCFKCKLYLCAKCYSKGHARHTSVCATGETKKKEKKVEYFVDKLLKQSRKFRRKKIKKDKHNPSVVDFVKVKHELDRTDCGISGICGLNSGRWIISDSINRSIKIIKLGSNVIERYICLPSPPFDVTEIRIDQTHTDSDSATSMACFWTDETEMVIETLLAVTLPSIRSILYINLNETPATWVKRIATDGKCYGIEFADDRIYTIEAWSPSRYFVCIYSICGAVLKRIRDMPYLNIDRHLAVASPDKIYVIDGMRDTVFCMDSEGVIMSQIMISGFDLTGISAECDNINVCSWRKNNVYRMDAELKQCRPVIDKKHSRFMKDTDLLCCFRDKLYVSHRRARSGIQNFVTVVKLYK